MKNNYKEEIEDGSDGEIKHKLKQIETKKFTAKLRDMKFDEIGIPKFFELFTYNSDNEFYGSCEKYIYYVQSKQKNEFYNEFLHCRDELKTQDIIFILHILIGLNYDFKLEDIILWDEEIYEKYDNTELNNTIIDYVIRTEDLGKIEYYIKNVKVYKYEKYNAIKNGLLTLPKTTEWLRLFCCVAPISFIEAEFKEKLVPDEECFYNFYDFNKCNRNSNFINYVDDTLNIFTQYGLNFTQDMFLFLVKKNLLLKEPLRYDVTMTEEIKKMYIGNKFIPESCKNCFTHEENLQLLFLEGGNMKKIKTSIKQNKIKPDLQCLKNACRIDNVTYIKFIVESFDVVPDAECMAIYFVRKCHNVGGSILAHKVLDKDS
jgi:hypothetical protein